MEEAERNDENQSQRGRDFSHGSLPGTPHCHTLCTLPHPRWVGPLPSSELSWSCPVLLVWLLTSSAVRLLRGTLVGGRALKPVLKADCSWTAVVLQLSGTSLINLKRKPSDTLPGCPNLPPFGVQTGRDLKGQLHCTPHHAEEETKAGRETGTGLQSHS